MYKCLDCGHIFEAGEEHIEKEYHNEIPGGGCEEFASCPICRGEFEETASCEYCGGAFLSDELVIGCYCEECLKDSLTYESFLEFATSGARSTTEIDTLEDFVFIKIFGLPKSPDISTPSLKAWCKAIYKETDRTVLMASVFSYMDEIQSLWNDYAEWLHGKEVRQ